MTAIATTESELVEQLNTRLPAGFPKGSICTRQAVLDVVTPEPTYSETNRVWQPVAYSFLIDQFEGLLEQQNRNVVAQIYALMGDNGARMISYYVVESVLDGQFETLALWSSHDKSAAVRIALGFIRYLCFNTVVTAEIKLARKHTKHAERDIPPLMTAGVGAMNSLRVNHTQRMEAYQGQQLNGDARSLLLDVVKSGGLTRTNFWQALAMYENNEGENWPNEDHKLPNNVYRLYQAATNPTMPIREQFRMCDRMHSVLDSACDFTPTPVVVETSRMIEGTTDAEATVNLDA